MMLVGPKSCSYSTARPCTRENVYECKYRNFVAIPMIDVVCCRMMNAYMGE